MLKKYFHLIFLFILFGLTISFASKTNIVFTLIITGSFFVITIIHSLLKLNRFALMIPEHNQPKTKYISILLSLFIMIVVFLVNKSSMSLMDNIVESISLFLINLILTYPINPIKYVNENNLYQVSCTKTIITETIPTIEEMNKLKTMGINVILFSKKNLPENISSKFKEVSIKSINTRLKKNDLHITNYTKKDISSLNKLSTYLYTKNLEESINLIYKSRKVVDNLVRTIRINDISSYSLSLFLIIPVIFGFPMPFNKNLLLAFILLKQFLNLYLIPNMEPDYDVLRRLPRTIDDKVLTNQEIVINALSIIGIVIGSSIIYMATLSAGATFKLSASLGLNVYLYSYIFILLINLSESLSIINIFKVLKDLCSLTIILLLIIVTIVAWYTPTLDLKMLNIINYRSTIIVALISTIWIDITKFARYLKRKRVK